MEILAQIYEELSRGQASPYGRTGRRREGGDDITLQQISAEG